MTKKSDARIARDIQEGKRAKSRKVLKDNTCWDELNSIYQNCVGLLSSHGHLAEYARCKDLIELVSDKVTLTANIQLLGRDLRTMSSELETIHAQHIDKVGGSDNPDVVMASIQMAEHYNLFIERHQAVIMPTVMHILEQFESAEHLLLKIAKEEADAQAALPSTRTLSEHMTDVTDVIVNEVTTPTQE